MKKKATTRFLVGLGLCLLLTAFSLIGLMLSSSDRLMAAGSQQTPQPAKQQAAPKQQGAPQQQGSQQQDQVQQSISPEALFATMLINAEKGQPQAMLIVAQLYEQGVGVPRHFTKAFEWYGKAANAGNPEAWRRLGACYEIGVGVAADAGKALDAYTKAASLGSALAQYTLAEMYLKGMGVAKDETRGMEYLDKAADNGDLAAMFELGVVLRDGLFGRKADPAQASQWFNKAADNGHANSILALAAMLKDGQGGKADPEGALRWYLIGQKGGMSGEALDAAIAGLRGKLTAAKVKEAEKAADAWMAARKQQAQAQSGRQP